jgi:hypothetical protein
MAMEGETRLPRDSELAQHLEDFAERQGPHLSAGLLRGLARGVEQGFSLQKILDLPAVKAGVRRALKEHTVAELEKRIDYVIDLLRRNAERDRRLARRAERRVKQKAEREGKKIKSVKAWKGHWSSEYKRKREERKMSAERDAKVAALYDVVKDQFQQLRDSLNAKLADGSLKLREIYSIVREFCNAGSVIAEEIQGTGEEKKALVIKALMDWWHDPVDGLKKLDLPGPDSFIDPALEAVLPVMAGKLLDWLVGNFNKVGWPDEG